MALFPESLLADLGSLEGAGHTFARQLADPAAGPLRALVEEVARDVPDSVGERWRDVLATLDNRRFFQGMSEVATAWHLRRAGWRVTGLGWPGPNLLARDPHGRDFAVLVLAFVRQARLVPDRAMIDRLSRSLNRVGSRSRIAVLVRRWLPHDFDPEPVRRAIDLWLSEVDRGGWDGRYAAYDDDNVSLEFALTGEKATADRGVVAFTLGPFEAQRAIEALETRVVFELDALRLRASRTDPPVLLSAVSSQPWLIPRGYLREMLYGKAGRVVVDGDPPVMELWYGQEFAPSLFRDSVYRSVSGLFLMELTQQGFAAASWLNPWSDTRVERDAFPGPSIGIARWEGDRAVLGWRR